MTAEQSEQYEICKKRRHEEVPADPASNYQNQLQAAQNFSPWKTCRWCGTQYREVTEKRQVEKA